MTGPAPVDHRASDADPTALAARRTCLRLGLGEPTLLRRGSCSLFLAGPCVLRVGVPADAAASAAALTALLADAGIRVPSLVDVSVDPASGLPVMVVERLDDTGPVDWASVGEQVRRVHALDRARVAAVHPLPSCTGFAHWDLRARLDEVASLVDHEERRALAAAVDRLAPWTDALSTAPLVVCHGDVHPANVVAAGGTPVLLDWDMTCSGPAAWDHAALLTWETRWGGTAGTYSAFAAGYGADLRGDPLAEMLATGRLLAATLMRLRAGRTDATAAAEARRRLRFWAGDPDAPQWRAM